MSDLIDRAAAIDTDGLDEEIRCEMCKNPTHTDRGCDGNCKYDEKLYKKIIQILDKRINPLPSAQPYTDEEIQKMQELEQAEIQKAYECGRASAQPERKTGKCIWCDSPFRIEYYWIDGEGCTASFQDEERHIVATGIAKYCPNCGAEMRGEQDGSD